MALHKWQSALKLEFVCETGGGRYMSQTMQKNWAYSKRRNSNSCLETFQPVFGSTRKTCKWNLQQDCNIWVVFLKFLLLFNIDTDKRFTGLVWSGWPTYSWLVDRPTVFHIWYWDGNAVFRASVELEMFVKRYLDIDVNSAAKGSPTFKEKCSKVDPKLR